MQYNGHVVLTLFVLSASLLMLTTNAATSEDEQSISSEDQLIRDVLDSSHIRVRRSNRNRRARMADAIRRRYRSPFRRGADGAMVSDNPTANVVRCGQVDMDATGALCCDGIVFSRRSGVDMRCCGRVAYDTEYFDCCGPRHRPVVVHRAPVMPACCDERSDVECPRTLDSPYGSEETGLGSVCCQVPGDTESAGGWRCCLRQDRCCDGVSAAATVDVPGYRPACCEVDRDVAARCCAETYQRIGLLPHCCDTDSLRPICCRRGDGSTRCCPATAGYCCGQWESPISSSSPSFGRRQQQSDGSEYLRPRTGDRTQTQRQTADRQRYNGDRYASVQAAAPLDRDRDRYDSRDRDRYPQERLPVVESGRSPDSSNSSNATSRVPCCVNPSLCCPGNPNGRQPACCRPINCPRPRCPRQNPGCPSCPGQGGGGGGCPPGCPGQGQGQGCPTCPGQGSGCPQGGGGCPPRCPGQGSGCPQCPGQGSGCPGQGGGCPGPCPGQGGRACPPPC